jgi:hypothetical protein
MMKVIENSICSQKQTGTSLKSMGQTNKHEGLNLMFVNHGKRMDYPVLLQ